MRILTLPGVLRPPSDARLLARTMSERGLARGRRVLDLGAGSGALAIVAALEGAREVSATDVSLRAVVNARINAHRNGVRVRALRGDLLAPVAGERFELIVSNPPYLPGGGGGAPGEGGRLPARGPARAWEGGPDGRALIDRICDEAPAHLAPGGALALVHSSLSGERATIERLAAAGLEAEVAGRERGPLGPLVAARAELLERRGLLAPGEREEEMLVFLARAPAEWQHPVPPRMARVRPDSPDRPS